ncbi:M20 family metallopeptidase [Streptomyces sp. NPDC058471]|uniref:M20 family metallopeptidase n=1 Tax=Streptomyces sp. NPDC058471 TaxID=3346516 RepID=UPI00365C32F9
MSNDLVADAERQMPSVIELAQKLIQQPSRGGIDDYGPVLSVLETWLTERSLPNRRLHDPAGQLVGLLVEIVGQHPGPWWTLDACVDTAPFGDESAWNFSPTCGDVADGWLHGRGAADSKLAASMFCHIAAGLHGRTQALRGGLAVLLDVDEHTGAFGGARAYLSDPLSERPAGVMIGYPGLEEVVVGGRGLWRATVSVYAPSGHSGSSRTVLNAVSRAARLVQLLDEAELPGRPAPGPEAETFPLPPKLTVTAVHGGQGFTVSADRCELNLDIRTTPTFGAKDAEALVRRAVDTLDTELPGPMPSHIEHHVDWPPFRLDSHEQPAAALLGAAHSMGLQVGTKTAGPSNIGNLLASLNVPATAGFGVPYEGLHAVNERAHLAEVPTVYAVYHQAVRTLLRTA